VPPIVDPAWVAALPAPPVLADVRWYLDGRDGRVAFEAGHLPGAVFVDLERDLCARDRPATDGRHPLPDPTSFADAMGRLGIGDTSIVVAYDDSGGATAGRLVVMLRLLGADAALLDGGLGGWADAHGLELGPGRQPVPARFTARPWPADRLASADDVARAASAGRTVLDARAHERYTGEVTMIDPRPGHVPGARSAPWAEVLDPATGRVRTPAELRAHFERVGAGDDTITYCGSGVSACLNVLAMEHAGLTPARLYVASWSGWSADPRRPTELGPGR
jgi:thiosulfate/3-mercaptopyruvate sulfurtransferase